MENEKQLLQQIRQGERRAQRRLYEGYSGFLMATCRRYVADQEAVRDVLHDCFLKIFTTIQQFEYRGEGSLRAWMATIAAHEAVSWLRQNDRFRAVDELPDTPEEEEPDVGKVPLAVMQRMIERLPSGYRTVFNLFVFEQLSHKQIAAMLGIKENTSASQYLRARKMLAREINEYIKQQRI